MSHELKKAIVAVLPEILDAMGIYSLILDVVYIPITSTLTIKYSVPVINHHVKEEREASLTYEDKSVIKEAISKAIVECNKKDRRHVERHKKFRHIEFVMEYHKPIDPSAPMLVQVLKEEVETLR